MNLVEAVATFARNQPPTLKELSRDPARRFLHGCCKHYNSKVALLARCGVPLTPAGMKELLRMSRWEVLRDIHCGGRIMDGDRCFRTLRELAGLNSIVE